MLRTASKAVSEFAVAVLAVVGILGRHGNNTAGMLRAADAAKLQHANNSKCSSQQVNCLVSVSLAVLTVGLFTVLGVLSVVCV